MTIDFDIGPIVTSNCHIRIPRSTDCERMAVLATQLGYPSSAEEIERRITEMADRERFAVYVAEGPDHKVLGWIGVYVFISVEVDKFAEISGLIVDQNARCHGVGAKLLRAAEEWARTVGCLRISVRSNVVRERAHKFYLSHAFEFTKAQKSFVKRLHRP
jgi:GNAT superfamily N-acetyltransferase